MLVLADSTNWRVGVPALTTSLRGGVNVVVEVRTLRHALHNGVYGGPTPDALTALARLLATCHTDAGDVAVAGLGRGTADPLDLTEAQFRADAGVLDGVALLGSGSLTSRLWKAPALSVVAIDAPAVDDAGLLLVPSARARLTLRIAPGDDPAAASEALVAHLHTHAPWGAEVTVTAGPAGGAVRSRRPRVRPTRPPGRRTPRRSVNRSSRSGSVGPSLRGAVRRGVPRCGDPDHRGRGPRHPCPRPQREPPPGRLLLGVRGRGAASSSGWAHGREPRAPLLAELVEILRQHPPPRGPVVDGLRTPGVDPVRHALAPEHRPQAPRTRRCPREPPRRKRGSPGVAGGARGGRRRGRGRSRAGRRSRGPRTSAPSRNRWTR